jgi:hypothetical protein
MSPSSLSRFIPRLDVLHRARIEVERLSICQPAMARRGVAP